MTLKIDFTAACCVHGFRIGDMCYVDITSAGVVSLYSLPSFLSPAPSLVQLTDGAGPLLHSGSGDCDSEVLLSTT